MFDVITLCRKKKMHALFCLYYVVIYEFKYESKMIKTSPLVLASRDIVLAPNESPRVIITYQMFKYSARVTLFQHEVTF